MGCSNLQSRSLRKDDRHRVAQRSRGCVPPFPQTGSRRGRRLSMRGSPRLRIRRATAYCPKRTRGCYRRPGSQTRHGIPHSSATSTAWSLAVPVTARMYIAPPTPFARCHGQQCPVNLGRGAQIRGGVPNKDSAGVGQRRSRRRRWSGPLELTNEVGPDEPEKQRERDHYEEWDEHRQRALLEHRALLNLTASRG
jgi:hypothetical protein